jgi:hypothetical protein
MTKHAWKIGDLIWVPRTPLGLFSKTGDMDFWKVGIITSLDKYNCVWFYHNDHFEKIHVKHIRRVES